MSGDGHSRDSQSSVSESGFYSVVSAGEDLRDGAFVTQAFYPVS